jgi:hypothetical protein
MYSSCHPLVSGLVLIYLVEKHVQISLLVPERKERLGPACDDCRKAKRHCRHRQPILQGTQAAAAAPSKRKRGQESHAGDNTEDVADSQNIAAAAAAHVESQTVCQEAEAPEPPAKRPRRTRQESYEGSGVLGQEPNASRPDKSAQAQLSTQPLRGSKSKGKRTFAEAAEESPLDTSQPHPTAAAAAGDNGVNTVDGTEPPRKRGRGRPRKAPAAVDAVRPVKPPARAERGVPVAPGKPTPTAFPADNLGGSSCLSYHQTMLDRLAELRSDYEAKQKAADAAMMALAQHMAVWKQDWTSGR